MTKNGCQNLRISHTTEFENIIILPKVGDYIASFLKNKNNRKLWICKMFSKMKFKKKKQNSKLVPLQLPYLMIFFF